MSDHATATTTLTPLLDGLVAIEHARTPGWKLIGVFEAGDGRWFWARVVREEPFCLIAARAERTRIQAIQRAFEEARAHD